MTDFIQGESRNQSTLFPERLDDYIAEENAVRVIDFFIDELPLSGLGFRTEPEALGRPAYAPSMMLKLYVYGYLNRVQSSRRLERECGRRLGCRSKRARERDCILRQARERWSGIAIVPVQREMVGTLGIDREQDDRRTGRGRRRSHALATA